MNYNLLLCIGIWAVFLALLVVPLPAGRGLFSIGEQGLRLVLPSWRFSLGQRQILLLSPLHLFDPVLPVAIFSARSETDISAQVAAIRAMHRQFHLVRDGLAVLAVMILVGIPLNMLSRGGTAFLVFALMAYLVYLAAWSWIFWRRDATVRSLLKKHWAVIAEPLLCLPMAPHALRKLFAADRSPLALVDVLAADLPLDAQQLRAIHQRLLEVREVVDDEARLGHLQQLIQMLEARLPPAEVQS